MSQLPSQVNLTIFPIRDIKDIGKFCCIEEVLRLKKARILLANYELIKRDFPELVGLTDKQIDNWILDNTAFMGVHQIRQTRVNSKIRTTKESRIAYRPPDYGRSLIFKVRKPDSKFLSDKKQPLEDIIGLIDAKGAGGVKPRSGFHFNGLMDLGEAIREYSYERMVNAVFQHDGCEIQTVGGYAVIDSGFRVKHANDTTSPAGIYLRQAHARMKGTFSVFNEVDCLKVERVIRKYGITSAGAHRHRDFDAINVQGTKEHAIVDFGGFLVVDDFRERNARHYYGTKDILIHTDDDFVRPDPALKIPFNIWGTSITGIERPKTDNIWIWSHELAECLFDGTASRADAEEYLYNFLMEPVYKLFNRKKVTQAEMGYLESFKPSLTGPQYLYQFED